MKKNHVLNTIMYKFLIIALTCCAVTGEIENGQNISQQYLFRKDYNYHQGSGWLKLHRSHKTWQEARRRCQAEGRSKSVDPALKKDCGHDHQNSSKCEAETAEAEELMKERCEMRLQEKKVRLWTQGPWYSAKLGADEGAPQAAGQVITLAGECSILASPLDDYLQKAIEAEMGNRAYKIFTGISATVSKGEYFTSEGISFDAIPTDWIYVNQQQQTHPCIAMYKNGLIDVSCNEKLPFVCYKEESELMPKTTECGTSDTGYIFKEETGHCYKLHSNGQTWDDAYLTCSIEGGYLAVINSAAEAKVLNEIITGPGNISATEKEVFGIGFHTWDLDWSFWMTIEGKTLKDAGYDNWHRGQPDNNTMYAPEGEYCGGISGHGSSFGLHDVACSITIPFICEMDFEQ